MKFHDLAYASIATEEGRRFGLDERPAVYAWYRSFSSLREDDPETFRDSVLQQLRVHLSADFQARAGWLYDVSICESPGDLSVPASRTLDLVAESGEARRALVRVLQLSEGLLSPLYVGKARRLRRRTREHVSGASGLVARLRTAGIRLSQCYLRYAYVSEVDFGLPDVEPDESGASGPDRVAQLLEELLTRLGPAAFVRRPG